MPDDEELKIFSLATGRPVNANQVTAAAPRAAVPKPKIKTDLSPPDTREPLSTLQLRAGLNDDQAATLCGVTRTTWRRWCGGKASPPTIVRRLLAMYAGDAPSTDRAWRGFVFRGDHLYAPNGEAVTAAEIENRKMARQHMDYLQARVDELQFWRTRAGRAEQVRLARTFGAIDMAAYVLVELHQLISQSQANAVKCEAGSLMNAINAVFACESRLAKAAGLEESQ